MDNTKKAILRKAARDVEAIQETVKNVVGELDEYIHDHQDTLEGTDRGEKLDNEMEAVYSLDDDFTMLKDAILESIGGQK